MRKMRSKVATVLTLRTFYQDYAAIVTTDASKKEIGAVLERDGPDGSRPVAFTSRALNAAEKNYAEHDLDLWAILDTYRAWRCYLHMRKFIVHTNHHPVRFLETQDQISPRQVRWLERLVDFDFAIIPVKGKSNHVADALSRLRKDIPKKQNTQQIYSGTSSTRHSRQRHIQNHRRSVQRQEVGERVHRRPRIQECLPRHHWPFYGTKKGLLPGRQTLHSPRTV